MWFRQMTLPIRIIARVTCADSKTLRSPEDEYISGSRKIYNAEKMSLVISLRLLALGEDVGEVDFVEYAKGLLVCTAFP
jgi:hypothetical protein